MGGIGREKIQKVMSEKITTISSKDVKALKKPLRAWFNWWRGEDLNFRPSGYELAVIINRSIAMTA